MEVRWIAVGRIGRAHGVRGEVAVLPLSEVDSRFEPASRLFLGEAEDRVLTVASARPHRHRLLVAFEQLKDRAAAEDLQGEYLFVPASSAPPLPEGEYWPHQLVGCEVVTESGRSLGRIREIMRGAANDIWAAEGDGGETLIPALRDVVESVDVTARRIRVREVPGLTAP
jgi:16S rRNA processing protein RimM